MKPPRSARVRLRAAALVAAALVSGMFLLQLDVAQRDASARATVQRHIPRTHRAASSRPDIVFILADDFSLDLVRFMPHLHAMEQTGLTFSNYFVSDSLCCPSRASILSGRFPHNTGGARRNFGPH